MGSKPGHIFFLVGLPIFYFHFLAKNYVSPVPINQIKFYSHLGNLLFILLLSFQKNHCKNRNLKQPIVGVFSQSSCWDQALSLDDYQEYYPNQYLKIDDTFEQLLRSVPIQQFTYI